MNLALIESKNSIQTKGIKSSKSIMKIKGEYPIERIIRISHSNGIKKIFCLIDPNRLEYKHYLSKNNFTIPLKLFIQETENSVHSLFVMAPFLLNEPFLLVDTDMVFIENEFREFIIYSLLQEDVDGTLAVIRNSDKKKPLCVAIDDQDIILKFSDVKDGYNWAAGGIYYFSPNIFNEMEYAVQSGISNLSKILQLLVNKKYLLKGFSFSDIIKVENAYDIAKAEDLIKRRE